MLIFWGNVGSNYACEMLIFPGWKTKISINLVETNRAANLLLFVVKWAKLCLFMLILNKIFYMLVHFQAGWYAYFMLIFQKFSGSYAYKKLLIWKKRCILLASMIWKSYCCRNNRFEDSYIQLISLSSVSCLLWHKWTLWFSVRDAQCSGWPGQTRHPSWWSDWWRRHGRREQTSRTHPWRAQREIGYTVVFLRS